MNPWIALAMAIVMGLTVNVVGLAAENERGDPMKRVIVELKTKAGWSAEAIMRMAATLPGFQIDETYEPVPTEPSEELVSALAPGEEVILIRGLVEEGKEAELKTAPNVLAVWTDGQIEPF